MFKEAKVVVVGSSNADMVAHVQRAPEAGETVLCESYTTVAGGKGANQVVAARRMGAKVTFVACVGEDTLGMEAIERFRQDGIDVRHITKLKDAPTGTAFIWVDSAGENRIVVASGANGRLSPDHVERAAAAIQEADVLLCQLETPLPAIQRALQIAREAGVKTILNPAPAVSLEPYILHLVDILTPNLGEASLILGETIPSPPDTERTAGRLLDRGVGAVCMTLGADGCLIMTANRSASILGAPAVQVVDTTAAGDTFAGALAALVGSGKSIEAAARVAVGAASLACTVRGAQPSIPRLETVEAFLAAGRR